MEDEKSKVFSNYGKQIKEAIADLKTKGNRHKQIPNILTTMRLAAPCFIIPAAIIGSVPVIIGSVIAFGLTDLVDGFVARHFNLTSDLGRDLDALADKVFGGTLLLAASIANPLLLVNVGLELAIAGINAKQKLSGREATSSFMGKAKTWALFSLAGVGLLSPALELSKLVLPFMLATTVMQGLTIGSYIKKYDRTKSEVKGKSDVAMTKQILKNDDYDYQKKLTKENKIEDVNNIIKEKTKTQLEELEEIRNYLICNLQNEKKADVKVKEKKYGNKN